MRIKKMYSAFISSVYSSLLDERYEVINCLLDYNIFPICMEHFTVTSSNKFDDIKCRIDDSDFFILLLGDYYGSCDTDGISWTEKEYNYAKEKGIDIIALGCDNIEQLLKLSVSEREKQSEDVRKQIEFAEKVEFKRMITMRDPIIKIIGQVLMRADFSKIKGWSRNIVDDEFESVWKQNHSAFDIGGEWFHVHTSDSDEKYIRIGTLRVTQKFDSVNYKQLTFEAINYNPKYNKEIDVIEDDIFKCTRWRGEYKLQEDGWISGIFSAMRGFSSTYVTTQVTRGEKRGIHDFYLSDLNSRIERFEGEFHDEAPSPKCGYVHVFRTKMGRDEFLKNEMPEKLEYYKI